MKYDNIVKAQFVERPNRFIAHCKIENETVIVHVKNTGRCKELLIPGATVYLEYAPSPKRKTDYSLIAVEKDSYLINMDSQAPNYVTLEGLQNNVIQLPNLQGEVTLLKREVKYGNSRFDVYIETELGEKGFIEVKGVTLEEDGTVMFPDAPTARGTKHIYELIQAKEAGYRAYILFIIQMKPVKYFTPNKKMDQAFAEALGEANRKGVEIIAYDCTITRDTMEASSSVEVRL